MLWDRWFGLEGNSGGLRGKLVSIELDSSRSGLVLLEHILLHSHQLAGVESTTGLWSLGSPCLEVERVATWLILPVVICLSQRLSHACLSINCLYCETANGSLNQL
jgi:hypothetical protein